MVESTITLLRIFINESDHYNGEPLYIYIVKILKAEKITGATVLRGIMGYGKNNHIHKASILHLSCDLPILIEVADLEENINRIKPKLDKIISQGLVTEEKIKIIL
jgi:uncharacterized protein